MTLSTKKIKEILVGQKYLSAKAFEKMEVELRGRKVSLTDHLISKGIITKDILGQAIAEYLDFPYADVNTNTPSPEKILLIPQKLAETYNAVVYKQEKGKLIIATDQPSAKLQSILQDSLKQTVELNFSLLEDIEPLFIHYRKSLATRFAQILEKEQRVAPEIIEEIFADALAYKASDIHFEPREKEVVIRFRVDGILHEAGRINKDFYDNILNRIKVQAHLRTDEHFSAQDGAFRYISDEAKADLRVSIVPIIDGEKVVIRLLAEYVRGFTLNDLGFSGEKQKILERVAKKPFGMIIVGGPTGSGKSTTLYAVLKYLNSPEVNIATIEDPVEYRIAGVNQIQVNRQAGLTFTKGLRSIVRQDPDIILVGEIRDKETAGISVNAALTGHLMLSTFHANDAATSIPRLLHMGVEPFLLSSTLELVVSQRLVRRLCEHCRVSYPESLENLKKRLPEAEKYFQATNTMYKGKGCISCNQSGYRGRTGIFELIEMTPELKELILTNPSREQLWAVAKQGGSKPLFDDGLDKVKAGMTTLEEVLRVAKPE